MKALLPSRALALFLFIGFTDLAVTAILHARGQIVELNPLLRPIIDHSEILFAIVKGASLVGGWITLAWYAKSNPAFVRKASLMGSVAYVSLWLVFFLIYL